MQRLFYISIFLFLINSWQFSTCPHDHRTISDHTSNKRSNWNEALAGLVDGSFMILIPVRSLRNRSYSSHAFAPFPYMRVMLERSRIEGMSFTITSRIETSLEPLIWQLSITSHTAMWFFRSSAFFSSIVPGTALPVIPAITFQKRFLGCP